MSAKALLVFCAQTFFIQSALSQCTSRATIDASGVGAPFGWTGPAVGGPVLTYNGLAAPSVACTGLAGGPAPGLTTGIVASFGNLDVTPTSGGALAVTSASAIAPTGISVVSENVFEGALSAAGELPFVGTTGMEGALPTAGAGAINHACGDDHVAMISDATVSPAAALTPAAAISPASAFTPAAASFTRAGAAYSATPFARRFGLGGCGHDHVY